MTISNMLIPCKALHWAGPESLPSPLSPPPGVQAAQSGCVVPPSNLAPEHHQWVTPVIKENKWALLLDLKTKNLHPQKQKKKRKDKNMMWSE